MNGYKIKPAVVTFLIQYNISLSVSDNIRL